MRLTRNLSYLVRIEQAEKELKEIYKLNGDEEKKMDLSDKNRVGFLQKLKEKYLKLIYNKDCTLDNNCYCSDCDGGK